MDNGNTVRIVQTAFDDSGQLVRQRPGQPKDNLFDRKLMNVLNVYKQVLDGSITPSLAKEYLASGIQTDDEEIVVTPVHVIGILTLYLQNIMSDKELSEWASFLIVADAYVCPDWEDDEKAEKYEPMWYVLQQLSSPEIDGEITAEGVKQHLDTLLQL